MIRTLFALLLTGAPLLAVDTGQDLARFLESIVDQPQSVHQYQKEIAPTLDPAVVGPALISLLQSAAGSDFSITCVTRPIEIKNLQAAKAALLLVANLSEQQIQSLPLEAINPLLLVVAASEQTQSILSSLMSTFTKEQVQAITSSGVQTLTWATLHHPALTPLFHRVIPLCTPSSIVGAISCSATLASGIISSYGPMVMTLAGAMSPSQVQSLPNSMAKGLVVAAASDPSFGQTAASLLSNMTPEQLQSLSPADVAAIAQAGKQNPALQAAWQSAPLARSAGGGGGGSAGQMTPKELAEKYPPGSLNTILYLQQLAVQGSFPNNVQTWLGKMTPQQMGQLLSSLGNNLSSQAASEPVDELVAGQITALLAAKPLFARTLNNYLDSNAMLVLMVSGHPSFALSLLSHMGNKSVAEALMRLPFSENADQFLSQFVASDQGLGAIAEAINTLTTKESTVASSAVVGQVGWLVPYDHMQPDQLQALVSHVSGWGAVALALAAAHAQLSFSSPFVQAFADLDPTVRSEAENFFHRHPPASSTETIAEHILTQTPYSYPQEDNILEVSTPPEPDPKSSSLIKES